MVQFHSLKKSKGANKTWNLFFKGNHILVLGQESGRPDVMPRSSPKILVRCQGHTSQGKAGMGASQSGDDHWFHFYH